MSLLKMPKHGICEARAVIKRLEKSGDDDTRPWSLKQGMGLLVCHILALW